MAKTLKNHYFREDMIGGGGIFAAVTNVSKNFMDSRKSCSGCPIATVYLEQFDSDRIRSVDIDQIEGLQLIGDEQADCTNARNLLLPRA